MHFKTELDSLFFSSSTCLWISQLSIISWRQTVENLHRIKELSGNVISKATIFLFRCRLGFASRGFILQFGPESHDYRNNQFRQFRARRKYKLEIRNDLAHFSSCRESNISKTSLPLYSTSAFSSQIFKTNFRLSPARDVVTVLFLSSSTETR